MVGLFFVFFLLLVPFFGDGIAVDDLASVLEQVQLLAAQRRLVGAQQIVKDSADKVFSEPTCYLRSGGHPRGHSARDP
jgi:hypothetical protein